MEEYVIDLSVGETIQIGEFLVRVVDTHGDEISIEIDGDGGHDVFRLKTCSEVLVDAF